MKFILDDGGRIMDTPKDLDGQPLVEGEDYLYGRF